MTYLTLHCKLVVYSAVFDIELIKRTLCEIISSTNSILTYIEHVWSVKDKIMNRIHSYNNLVHRRVDKEMLNIRSVEQACQINTVINFKYI